jgi:aspartate--ammonia ligase
VLARYGFKMYEGLYTDMNAIRRDEELDNLHSIYVDQWDWEKIIDRSDRTEEKLRDIVKTIYRVFRDTEQYLNALYPMLGKSLPEDIYFITAQELEDLYPSQTPKMREYLIAKEKKAVFLMKIGQKLKSGERHDGRAPDYDDWELNGDILFWYPPLDCAFELSSMGIRVDEKSLEAQLSIAGCEERKSLPFHSMLLRSELPYTVGGGIGQSRICMFFLQKAHIGEVQASVWPDDMIHECFENRIYLL